MSYLISDYNYTLPEDLIAQQPVFPRDQSRMLVLNREKKENHHKSFLDLPQQLEENSILVINNSKVIPARLPGERTSGGKIEALLVHEESEGLWNCKLKNLNRVKVGETIWFCNKKLECVLIAKKNDGTCTIQFKEKENLFGLLEQYGYAPIPPYIRKARGGIQTERSKEISTYQTVFAERYGAVAAPTAGLHFSEGVIEAIKARGIKILSITLHVGLGTFEPIRKKDIREHKMHREYFEISKDTAQELTKAKREGNKIVAVGTTTARTLESAWTDNHLSYGNSSTDIFIYPSYKFAVVDQLLTNFHLPESSLMMLVSALAGKERIMDTYQEAIEEKYRFYSYGDCMLIQ